MKRIKKRFFIITLIFLLLTAAGYFALAFFYLNGFSVNTWINDIYCTGKTVEEVNRELLAQEQMPETITVKGLDLSQDGQPERVWQLSAADIEYSLDYTAKLEEYIAGQRQWLWLDNVTLHRTHTLKPGATFDEEKLRSWMEGAEGVLGSDRKPDCTLEYTGQESGYTFYDGLENLLDRERAYEAVKEKIAEGETEISLVECGCYYDQEPTAGQKRMKELWELVRVFQEGGPTYDFSDESFQLGPGVMALFLKKDVQWPYLPLLDVHGRLQLDETAIADYVSGLSETFSTYGKEWEFQSTRGEVITVQGVTYGGQLDQKAETAWLQEYLENLLLYGSSAQAAAGVHMPSYTKEPFCRNSQNLGGTYIEVDMGIQKLYYYVDGELQLETDIVSGNGGRTPEGVNFVYGKETNRILRGPGYASPVDYWMPVKGNIGIHDADWRDRFGGEIYKTGGSHGCINVPPDVMPQLYENVELGTPVVMFY